MVKRKIFMFIASIVAVTSLTVGTAFAKSNMDEGTKNNNVAEYDKNNKGNHDDYFYYFTFGKLNDCYGTSTPNDHNKISEDLEDKSNIDFATKTPGDFGCNGRHKGNTDLATSTPNKDKNCHRHDNIATVTPELDEDAYNEWLQEYNKWLDECEKYFEEFYATNTPGDNYYIGHHGCSNVATKTPDNDGDYHKHKGEKYGTITPEFDEEAYNEWLKEYEDWLKDAFVGPNPDFNKDDKEHSKGTVTPCNNNHKDDNIVCDKKQNNKNEDKNQNDIKEEKRQENSDKEDKKSDIDKTEDFDATVTISDTNDNENNIESQDVLGQASNDSNSIKASSLDNNTQASSDTKTSNTADGRTISFGIIGTLMAGIAMLFAKRKAK